MAILTKKLPPSLCKTQTNFSFEFKFLPNQNPITRLLDQKIAQLSIPISLAKSRYATFI